MQSEYLRAPAEPCYTKLHRLAGTSPTTKTNQQEATVTFISYAQNFEKLTTCRALKQSEHGFYINISADDPVTFGHQSLLRSRLAWHEHGTDADYYDALCSNARAAPPCRCSRQRSPRRSDLLRHPGHRPVHRRPRRCPTTQRPRHERAQPHGRGAHTDLNLRTIRRGPAQSTSSRSTSKATKKPSCAAWTSAAFALDHRDRNPMAARPRLGTPGHRRRYRPSC